MSNRLTLTGALLIASFITGCAAPKPSLYQWGSYQNQVYAMYSDPGKVPVEKQIEELEADYQKARAANRPVPPGYHAHLGYLYFQSGKTDQAKQSFQTEKTLFPESSTYMDLVLKQAQK